jgi:uncharacterized protein (DUF2147 family)
LKVIKIKTESMKLVVSLFALLFSSYTAAPPANADAILGMWMTDSNKAKIQIYKQGNQYNGKIVWLKEPLNEQGQPKTDKENNEKSLRSRPVVGVNLIKGFEFNGEKWDGGEIYDPENGKTYSCVVKLKGDKLEVRGYVGMTMFGRTVVWERAKSIE